MPRGTQALLDLPAETIAILRATGARIVVVALPALVAAVSIMMLGALDLWIGGALERSLGAPPAPSLVAGFPTTWLILTACVAAGYAIAAFLPLQMIAERHSSAYAIADERFFGFALLHYPFAFFALLPVPDEPAWESLTDVPMNMVLVLLAVSLLVLAAAAVTITLAPAIYARETHLGMLGALGRSRELARGRRLLCVTVAALPPVLAAAGIFSLVFGSHVTMGGAVLGFAFARILSPLIGIACLGSVPTLASALQTAALNIATRAD